MMNTRIAPELNPDLPDEAEDKSMRHIQRDRYYNLWKVSFERKRQLIYKYFADSAYGGKEAALKIAQAYRDQIIFQKTDPDYQMWRRNLPRPDNTSGVTGVGRYLQCNKNKTISNSVWMGYWRDADKKRHTRTFSVKQYGEEGAKQRAIQARQTGMEDVKAELERRAHINRPVKHPIPEMSSIERNLWFRGLIRNNNHTGIAGVGSSIKSKQGILKWTAEWHDADGKRHSRAFSVKKYGAEQAKQLAIETRQAALVALKAELERREQGIWPEPVPELSAIEQVIHKQIKLVTGNNSGIAGVYFVPDKTHNYPRWQANWRNVDGKMKIRKFSVKKYGAERAKQLAMESRQAGIDTLRAELERREQEGLPIHPKKGP